MQISKLIARMVWRATKYLFLIVFSSILGAQLGTEVGAAIGVLTGEAGWWVAQGRCAGWTVFILLAVVGGPFGFVYFFSGTQPHSGNPRPLPALQCERTKPVVDQKTVGGIKAILMAPLIGAIMGLLVGGILSGFLVAFYFFVALSPLGPGGWWPILPVTFHARGDGFTTKDPFILIPWLVVVGTFVALGVLFGLAGISVGRTHYQVFRSRKD